MSNRDEPDRERMGDPAQIRRRLGERIAHARAGLILQTTAPASLGGSRGPDPQAARPA